MPSRYTIAKSIRDVSFSSYRIPVAMVLVDRFVVDMLLADMLLVDTSLVDLAVP